MTQWATWLPPVETRVGATDTDEVEFGVIRIDRSHLNRFDICNLQGAEDRRRAPARGKDGRSLSFSQQLVCLISFALTYNLFTNTLCPYLYTSHTEHPALVSGTPSVNGHTFISMVLQIHSKVLLKTRVSALYMYPCGMMLRHV